MSNWNRITKLTTKRGRYGASKLKAFTVLSNIAPDRYLPVRSLCLLSGIDYYSLGRALPRWTIWFYVGRYPTSSIGEGDYMYQLLAKGKSWLKLAMEQLPNASIFIEELEVWQHDVMKPEVFQELKGLPFNQFVHRLNELIKVSKTK